MCKICKTCSKSNFGVTIKKAAERAARMVDGKITEYFEDSKEAQEEVLINYCFTCSKEITEEDLIEIHECKVCKRNVEHVNKDGVCTQCEEEVDKLSQASREDLILMILKQNKQIETEAVKILDETKKVENKREKNKEKLVKNSKKDDTMKIGYRAIKSLDAQIVEIDNKKKPSSRRKVQSKNNEKSNDAKKEKETSLISQENMDKAIKDNKEKVKSIPNIKIIENQSLDYVTDKNSNHIEDIKDLFVVEDIKEDILINKQNNEIADDVIHNTLMEIENIMSSISSCN